MTQAIQIVLKQEQKQSVLREKAEQIVLKQEQEQIVIRGGPIVANILPFSSIATANGQTVFYLYDTQGNPLVYSQIICLFIMGTGQDILTGDFTFTTNVITLGPTAPAIFKGDVVFGSGMV